MTLKYPEDLPFLLLSGADGPQPAESRREGRRKEGGGKGGKEEEVEEGRERKCACIPSGVEMRAHTCVSSFPSLPPSPSPPETYRAVPSTEQEASLREDGESTSIVSASWPPP